MKHNDNAVSAGPYWQKQIKKQAMNKDYQAFLEKKAQIEGNHGFAVSDEMLPDVLFDFQKYLVQWALRKGRAALFEDCGLGKSIQAIVWADQVSRHTNRPVLILTPLAVASQFVREGEKFGYEIEHSRDGSFTKKIVVTNYERLHYFSPTDFVGVVCDESSILKNFDGKIKASVTEFLRTLPYRLLCTATAAPNDYIELGTSSEALGYLGYMDMLGQFFKNDQGGLHLSANSQIFGKGWRFKAHAEMDFWRWMCSWSRAIRRPSDIGFSDAAFQLPELKTESHIVEASRPMDGYLFAVPAVGLAEQRKERAATITERCEKAASLVSGNDFSVVWCELNAEGDLLEKLIPGATQIAGKDSDEAKEEKFEAFQTGQAKILITKPSIGAWGLNWQHCNHTTIFPSHSFEQFYQMVRRFWRFGQKRPVKVDLVTTAGQTDVMQNLQRKSDAADRMFSAIVRNMNNELSISRQKEIIGSVSLPQWI